MNKILDYLNKGISDLHPYEPGRSIEDVIAEYKQILAPIESDWLKEMSGKGLDGDAVLTRAREIITSIER